MSDQSQSPTPAEGQRHPTRSFRLTRMEPGETPRDVARRIAQGMFPDRKFDDV
jgi:hypothetical protein